jgi:hypothetical protein
LTARRTKQRCRTSQPNVIEAKAAPNSGNPENVAAPLGANCGKKHGHLRITEIADHPLLESGTR